MAKVLLLSVILGCIDYKGQTHVVGGAAFECDAKEAKRLIDLGVAEVAEPEEKPVSGDSSVTNELLSAIESATTVEELAALMPAEEPSAEIIAAFDAKMIVLEAL